jgi:hypothetical protein
MKSFKELHDYLYNRLVDISNAETWTVFYLIGKKYKVCDENGNDTIKIAKDAINYFVYFTDSDEYKNKQITDYNKLYEEKIATMMEAFFKIAEAKKKKFENVWFDYNYYYFKEDTVDVAEKCLKIIKEYV